MAVVVEWGTAKNWQCWMSGGGGQVAVVVAVRVVCVCVMISG